MYKFLKLKKALIWPRIKEFRIKFWSIFSFISFPECINMLFKWIYFINYYK